MALFGVVIATWGTFMIGYTIYKTKNKSSKKIEYLDLSKYEVKYKRMDSSLNERAKGMFK